MVMKHKTKKNQDFKLIKIEGRSSSGEKRIAATELQEERRSAYVLAEQNIFYTSFISLVFLPYILGMCLLLILFYFYMDISVKDFFHVYSGFSQILFWIFGSYLMVTLFDIWWIIKKVFSKGKRQ
jgi:hypothetical protein